METLNYIKPNWVLGHAIVYKCSEIKLHFTLRDMARKYNTSVVGIPHTLWNNSVKFNFWNQPLYLWYLPKNWLQLTLHFLGDVSEYPIWKSSCSLIILPRWAMGRTRPLPRCCPVKITRPNLPFNKKFQRYKHDTNGIFFGLLAWIPNKWMR